MAFRNTKKLASHNTSKLVGMINTWGLPFDLEDFNDLVDQSYSLYELMTNYEKKYATTIPDQHSDNFISIIDTLWSRHHPDVISTDIIERNYYSLDDNPTAEQLLEHMEIYDLLMSTIQTSEKTINGYFASDEVVYWLYLLPSSIKLTPELLDRIGFIDQMISDFSDLQEFNDDIANLVDFLQLQKAEVLMDEGYVLRGNALFEELLEKLPQNEMIYLTWADRNLRIIENTEQYHEDMGIREHLLSHDKIEEILDIAQDIVENNTDEKIIYYLVDNFRRLYSGWKPELANKYQKKLEKLEINKDNTIDNDLDDQFSPEQIEKLREVMLVGDNEALNLKLNCTDCWLGYTIKVNSVRVDEGYIETEKYYSAHNHVDNGKIMFNKEIKCPTCGSVKYQVKPIDRMRIQLQINNNLTKRLIQRRFYTMNLEFEGYEFRGITGAVRYWKGVLQKQPDDAKVYVNIANFLILYNYFKPAKKYLLRALKLDKQLASTYLLLGKIYFEWGEISKSKVCLKRMHTLDPNFAKQKVLEFSQELKRLYHKVTGQNLV